MCTVTYIPPTEERGFILTSNRDEKEFRPTISPATYLHNDIKLAYPKDEKAGGSWIAVNENNKVCCLLNGAFVAHQKQEFHTLSRGTILLEFTASDLTVHEFFASKELRNVEPFTIVTIEQTKQKIEKLTEFVWDGRDKHFRQLDKNTQYIWSSVTLYNDEHRKLRKEWFAKFYAEFKNKITPEKILSFHSGEHTSDNSINVIMQREGGLKTVSITQVSPENGQLKMSYTDLLNNSNHDLLV
jgi:uncharacterized protein with NRDE domain